MTVTANGTEHEVAEGTTLAALLAGLDTPDRGVAVAVDGRLVRRADWPATTLSDGATVEILTAVQGG